MTSTSPTPTAADRETARQLLSDFDGGDVGDTLYVFRLARMLAEHRAAGHAAGLAAAADATGGGARLWRCDRCGTQYVVPAGAGFTCPACGTYRPPGGRP